VTGVQTCALPILDGVIVNPTLVLGAGDIYRQAGSIITQVASRKLTVATEGGINCVHIADVVDGHLAALACGRTGERYILGGENLTHLALIQEIAEVVGVPVPGQVVPSWLLRSLAGPAQTLSKFLDLPISPNLLRFAGLYFYYITRKAENDLRLPVHRPIRDAISEAFDWFQQGAVSHQSHSSPG